MLPSIGLANVQQCITVNKIIRHKFHISFSCRLILVFGLSDSLSSYLTDVMTVCVCVLCVSPGEYHEKSLKSAGRSTSVRKW